MARLGAGSFVGLALLGFATDGVAADIDMWFPVEESFDGLQAERDLITFNDLSGDFESTPTLAAGQRRVTGTLKLKATYGGLQDLLRAITGHNSAPTGSGPYTYSFTPVPRSSSSHYVFGSTPRGWCIEVFKGGSAANSTFYQGCVISSVKIAFKPNSLVEIDLSFQGRKYTSSAKSTPTFKVDRIKTPTGQVANMISLGGTQYVTHSADLEIALNVEPRYDVSAVDPLQPLPSSKQGVTLSCEIETDDDAFLARLDDPETQRFTSGSLSIVESASRSLIFTFDELVLKPPAEQRATSLGLVKSSLTMMAMASTITGPSYTVALINSESAYNS